MPYQWKPIIVNEIVGSRFKSPTYSPSRKFMLDYKRIGTSYTIIIMNMETNVMKVYATIEEEKEYICCFYWLNNDEIVVITQGGLPYNEEHESVYYRLYKIDHEIGEAIMQFKWHYLLPRLSRTLDNFPVICTTPLIINGNAFCVFQVGSELLLFPWDVRFPNPSYPPIRIDVQIEHIDDMALLKPRRHGGRAYYEPSWCNYYCFESSIYLQLQITTENKDGEEIFPSLTDRLFCINLTKLDLTSRQIIINRDSSEWSVVSLTKITSPETDYHVEFSQSWQNGEFLLQTSSTPNDEGTYTVMFLINLKEKTVKTENVEHYEHHEDFCDAIFTLFNNKYLVWAEYVNEDKWIFSYKYQVQPSRHLPIQTLYQMCWGKTFMATKEDPKD